METQASVSTKKHQPEELSNTSRNLKEEPTEFSDTGDGDGVRVATKFHGCQEQGRQQVHAEEPSFPWKRQKPLLGEECHWFP